jgi:hypothetical protein
MSDSNVDETKTEILDVSKKRKQLQNIWSRTVNLCDAMIREVEEGRAKIRASMVREIIQFLKLSTDVLDDMEQLNKKLEQQRWIEGDENSSDVPFPVDDGLTLEDLGDFPFPAKDEEELKTQI